MRVSVLTPTYNRSEKLHRLYSSLEASTYKDFEWIIVDDGSTDDTEDVIREFQKSSTFPIRYYYQENKGKHCALNWLYDLAETEFCFQIDDDDELLPDAMEKGLRMWDSMDPAAKDRIWCINGRCVKNRQMEMVGKPFPENINSLSKRALKKVLEQCKGEKCGFQKVSIVKQYKFPEIEGCKFIFESFLWDQIKNDYDQFYTNEIFRIYHIPPANERSLSNRKYEKSKEHYLNAYRLYKYILQECPDKYKFLSKRYLLNVLYAKNSAENAQISNKELFSGLKLREKIILRIISIYKKVFSK